MGKAQRCKGPESSMTQSCCPPLDPSHLCLHRFQGCTFLIGPCMPSLEDLSSLQISYINPRKPSHNIYCHTGLTLCPFLQQGNPSHFPPGQTHILFFPLTDLLSLFLLCKHCSHWPFTLTASSRAHIRIQESMLAHKKIKQPYLTTLLACAPPHYYLNHNCWQYLKLNLVRSLHSDNALSLQAPWFFQPQLYPLCLGSMGSYYSLISLCSNSMQYFKTPTTYYKTYKQQLVWSTSTICNSCPWSLFVQKLKVQG